MTQTHQEPAARYAAILRSHLPHDLSRDDLVTKAAENALNHMLWRLYDGPAEQRPSELEVEAVWAMYERSHRK